MLLIFYIEKQELRVTVMMFNATFNNISVISWRSVLLVEETGENHRPAASHGQTLSHNVVSSTPHHEQNSNRNMHFQLTWPLGHVSYCHHFSSVVHPPTFHILIFSSETTGPIATKLWQNGPWMAPFQNCVRWSRLPTKMAAKLKIEKRGG